MRPRFTPLQRLRIARAVRAASAAPSADESGGELNVIPFLDVVMNILMFVMATITTVFTAALPVPAPSTNPTAATAPPSVTVQITRDGYVVGTPDGYLQSDCHSLGSAVVTVPIRPRGHDPAALSRCLHAARSSATLSALLRHVRNVNVSANGALPYDVLVSTLDATRETRPGANDLFPSPHLGVVR